LAQTLDVLVREQPDVAARPRRTDQPDALVVAQGLRMDAAHLRGHADVVVRADHFLARRPPRLAAARMLNGHDHPSRCRFSSWNSSRSLAVRLVGRMTRTLA